MNLFQTLCFVCLNVFLFFNCHSVLCVFLFQSHQHEMMEMEKDDYQPCFERETKKRENDDETDDAHFHQQKQQQSSIHCV